MNISAGEPKKSQFSRKKWLSIVIPTAGLLALVGYAANETVGLFAESIATVIVLVTAFHFLFGSRSAFFNIVFANAMTVYLCLFTFFVESVFATLPPFKISVGFLLPLAAFLLGVVYRRREIMEIIASRTYVKEAEFLRSFLWFLPIIVVGITVFCIHQSKTLPVEITETLFILEMSTISGIVFLASRDFTLMMIDAGFLFGNFFTENARLVKPVFAFFTFYSLSVIIFASMYRVIEHLSVIPQFKVFGATRDISFVESMYFSFVTASTLGYGDILPDTNAMRLLVSVQGLVSMLLFFFGVHAVLAHDADKENK